MLASTTPKYMHTHTNVHEALAFTAPLTTDTCLSSESSSISKENIRNSNTSNVTK